MTDLIGYNINYVPKSQGLQNFGNTCYFNSLLQGLLSCPSIYEVLSKIRDAPYVKKNRLASNLLLLWESALREEKISDLSEKIWKDIVGISRARQDGSKMQLFKQEDAHEGLMMFLAVMEKIPEVYHLFEHRHQTEIYCDNCNKVVSNIKATNLVFEVQPNLETEQLDKFKSRDAFYSTVMNMETFLKKQNGYVDKDFICPECKTKGERYKTITLTMVPEILPIVIKKYQNKVETPFPARLEFTSSKSTKLVYQIVAQIEHIGMAQGGHYWTIGYRPDGWKELNDSRVSDGQPGPRANTYILFYHFMGEEAL